MSNLKGKETLITSAADSERTEIKNYIDNISLKGLADYIAQLEIEKISKKPPLNEPRVGKLISKVATQKDLESDWARFWIKELSLEFAYNRKLWEYSFLLQALYSAGLLQADKRGIGFGCGLEPIPSYLTSKGCYIVASDKPDDACDGNTWRQVHAYSKSLESLHWKTIVDRDVFMEKCELQYIDMNNIFKELYGQFDFCWSICACEHLGGVKAGLNFIHNSLKVLKPGGVSVHTTEFDYMNTPGDFDTPTLCFFKREHFEKLTEEIKVEGG